MPQSWVGQTIGGRYQIEALLGQGGMSAVYRATDPNLRRQVAIKLIHPHLSTDPNFIGRFKEEAAAVARLRHPNIVQVHDFNVDGETYYMVMEYLVGETLQARLKRLNATGRKMPMNEALELCIQICNAAGYAHNHELVHRDIKPANVMLDVNGQAILMDFGIVKIIGGDQHTATGATIGTAKYMSPEQIRSERVDDRADIYSLGVTLYEMLSGQPPYTADSTPTLIMMVLNDPLPDLHEIRDEVPESLVRVVQKALSKKTTERFQSMEDMVNALQQVQAELNGLSPDPITTPVDKEEVEPVSFPYEATTIVDNSIEGEIADSGHQQLDNQVSSASTLQNERSEIISTQSTPPIARKQVGTRLGSRRILLTAIGLILLVVMVTFGLMYANARKPPELQLSPISHPPQVLGAQTALEMVNLGKWETDSQIDELVFSPDGNLLGTANNRDQARFSQYRFYTGLWQIETGSLRNYQFGHTQWVNDVDFSSDGQFFASASDDDSVLLWRVADGSLFRKIQSPHGGAISLDLSPNNLLLATGSWDGFADLWQISNGNLLRSLNRENEDGYGFRDVAFSPDGTLLAAASDDNSILLWNVSDGSLVYRLQDHTAPVYKVVFSTDGSLLASTSEDHTIKIWQLRDGALLQSMTGHTDVVYDAAFSPDDSLLASGSSDGTLRLWRVNDGTLLRTLIEYSDSIQCVDFSPDGHLLVSGAADGVVHFWGISEAIPSEGE